MGRESRDRNRNVSHSDAVPRDITLPANGGPATTPSPRLGSLRHEAYRVSSIKNVRTDSGSRILARLSGVLHVEVDFSGSLLAFPNDRLSSPCRLCFGMEKIRTALGPRHSSEASGDDAALSGRNPFGLRCPSFGNETSLFPF